MRWLINSFSFFADALVVRNSIPSHSYSTGIETLLGLSLLLALEPQRILSSFASFIGPNYY